MRSEELLPHRERVIRAAEGRVLEVGIGSGLNLPYYGAGVREIHGIDPSPALLAKAGDAAGRQRLPLTLQLGRAEALPYGTDRFDTAVCTWSLCSVGDPDRALAEIRRVLRPGGTMLFIEHGLAPDGTVARWQHRLNPLWRRCAGGCNLDRDMAALIGRAGLRIDRLETGYRLPGPRLLTWLYEGAARSF
jgi:ubiquinone/menaquinone biosynthesis C-methylase UbiE